MNTLVKIPKNEYTRLKNVEKRMAGFLSYFDYMHGIQRSREEVVKGKFVSQEKLFKKLKV